MIAQIILTILLMGILVYAWAEYRRSPVIGLIGVFAASGGLISCGSPGMPADWRILPASAAALT